MDDNHDELDAPKIIDLLGGTTKTAALCDITPGAVSQWRHAGIPKSQLKYLKLARPDLFPKQSPIAAVPHPDPP